MKKIITILATFVLTACCLFGMTACGKDEQTLYVYTNAGFAPFEYVNEKSEVVGVDIDIMQEIGEILGYKVIINDISFDNIFNEVKSNKNAVGAAGISKKAERDAICLASDVYFSSTQYVIAPNGTFTAGEKVTVDQIATAVGELNIGVQTGTTGADLINKDYASKTIGYRNSIIASGDIGSSLGAVVIDKLPAKSICKSNTNLSYWEIDAEVESYVLYFNKEQTELVSQVNKIIAYLCDNNIIDYFVAKHSGEILIGD